ncbi:hypothetical protein T03_2623 [Trichinella britovi]|uniref:Uncharacterized protein n=1 Tax=Trichinella britovi TaxID=45882 RepID=A0A0V1CFD3_TRIBR|nr:hypothetical protein T03_2623 [Trichinella britovi]
MRMKILAAHERPIYAPWLLTRCSILKRKNLAFNLNRRNLCAISKQP